VGRYFNGLLILKDLNFLDFFVERQYTLIMDKKANISKEPISKEVEDRVHEKIIQARVGMLWTQKFFGSLAMRLQMQPADEWCPTMAVDGKYLYYNHRFVDNLTNDELVFVFAHEISHLVFDHLGRNEGRNRKLYNCAADYVVNDDLILANVGKFPTEEVEVKDPVTGRTHKVKQDVGLHDIKYRGWLSEDVYEDLQKNQQKNNGSGQGGGSGQMSLDEMLDKLLDEHLDPSQTGDGSGDGGQDGKPSKSGPAKLSDEERNQIKAEMRDNIVNAAKLCAAGSLPAGINRLIQNLTAPKMDWRELLQCQIDSMIPADYSFTRICRKGWGLEAILPGLTTEKMLNVVVAIDQSGSINSKEAQQFLSEVNGMMQQFPQYAITVFCFDTVVLNPQTFTSENGEDICNYQPMGGGGTSFESIFDYLKEEGIVPTRLIVFTDGYPNNTWGDEFYTDVTWIISTPNIVPPFGEYAYIDLKNM
jgi:predicted metal-dependent peptidase